MEKGFISPVLSIQIKYSNPVSKHLCHNIKVGESNLKYPHQMNLNDILAAFLKTFGGDVMVIWKKKTTKIGF